MSMFYSSTMREFPPPDTTSIMVITSNIRDIRNKQFLKSKHDGYGHR